VTRELYTPQQLKTIEKLSPGLENYPAKSTNWQEGKLFIATIKA